MSVVTQADIARKIAVFQITQLSDIERGHPYPGQRYRHGWIPVTPDLSALSDDELADAFHDATARDVPDEDALARIDAEFARREPFGDLSADDLSPTQRRIDSLLTGGMSYRDAYAEAHDLDPDDLTREDLAAVVDEQRLPGETRERAVRRMYDEYVQISYLRAEARANGHLLSPAGRAARIDPVTLFSGQRARARKYASEELKRFWAEVEPRQTYTEFRAAVLGRASDKRAAEKIAQQGQERDFGL